MSKTTLRIMAVVLIAGGLWIVYGYIPSRQSAVAKRGIKVEGQVLLKDMRPGKDGAVDRVVTLIYKDNENRNHQIDNIVDDAGLYGGLQANQYVTMFYLPEDKSKAFMQGAYAIINPPPQPGGPSTLTVVSVAHVGGWRFLAWSMVLAGIAAGVYAWFKPKTEQAQKPTGPSVTTTRR